MLLIDEAKCTVADLHREPGKAELIGGKIVRFMATGMRPSIIARNILVMLLAFVKLSRRGNAFGDNLGYIVPELPSRRESFCPDASYNDGPLPDDEMDFIPGPPTFAVEIRSKDGYGPIAEKKIAAKRADYFSAGTLVVWDMDSKSQCIYAYSASAPDLKRVFRRGDSADAESALPGWRASVDAIFETTN